MSDEAVLFDMKWRDNTCLEEDEQWNERQEWLSIDMYYYEDWIIIQHCADLRSLIEGSTVRACENNVATLRGVHYGSESVLRTSYKLAILKRSKQKSLI